MSRLLALLGVLALLAAPLNAAAAQRACTHMDMAAAGHIASHAAPDGASGADPMADMPCCDPHPGQSADACLAACLVMAGVAVDLPRPVVLPAPAFTWTRFEAIPAPEARPHPPPGVERPPRPIA